MRVLIVDVVHKSMTTLLGEIGLEADEFPDITYEETLQVIDQYAGLIIRSKFRIGEEFLAKASKLKFIGRTGAGLDLIDLDACHKRGIAVFGANEGNSVSVAEHLIGMLLSLFTNIVRSNEEVRNYQWSREENRGIELFGKTVGIIGYGNNGSETANRLAALGCKVLAYDKYKSGFGNEYIREATLQEIYDEADILTLHIPLTDETKAWVNEDFFNQFRKSIYFCNVARGPIVDTSGLIKALQSNKVLGACLDVLENEKLTKLTVEEEGRFDFLKDHPRVIITPHVAGWTFESYEKLNVVLADKIKSFLEEKKS